MTGYTSIIVRRIVRHSLQYLALVNVGWQCKAPCHHCKSTLIEVERRAEGLVCVCVCGCLVTEGVEVTADYQCDLGSYDIPPFSTNLISSLTLPRLQCVCSCFKS